MSILLAVLLFGVWSSVFSLAKFALHYGPPVFLTGFRMALAGVLLLGYLALRKRSEFRVNRKQMLSIFLLAIFSIYLTNVLEFWGLQYLTAAKACFLYSLTPLFSAFFSYLHFGERMNRRKWLGLIISFIGILPVLSLQTGSEELWHAVGFLSWPTLALIGAVLCSVYGWVLLRVVVKDQMMSPLMANGSSMLVGGALALFHSYFVDPWTPTPVIEGGFTAFFGWSVLMAFIYNIVCYNVYGLMLKKFTATFLSFIGLLSPIFASLHGWLFLGEPLSWMIFLATSIVCIGIWLVYSAELKQGYIVKKKALEQPSYETSRTNP